MKSRYLCRGGRREGRYELFQCFEMIQDGYTGLLDELIDLAFREDIGSGDLATEAIFSPEQRAEARLVAKAEGVVSGLWVVEHVFRRLDAGVVFCPRVQDGARVSRGDLLATVEGRCVALLSGERLALNFLQRMSGIATQTRAFVEAIGNLPTRFLDTRKTVPGLRVLDKMAVRDGGGANHRMGLYDLAMIKDNHIAAAGGILPAVQAVRARIPVYTRVEVETTTLEEVDLALEAGADIIMLDNMDLEQMRGCVRRIDGRALTEASGNITLARVRAVAETGVDFLSSGSVTHSVEALDISMKIEMQR